MPTTRNNWSDTLAARRRGEHPDFHGAVPLPGTGDPDADPEVVAEVVAEAEFLAGLGWAELRATAKARGVAVRGGRAAITAALLAQLTAEEAS